MATKAEIDAWIQAQGGPDAVDHSFEDVEVPDPRGMRSLPDGSENPDYDYAFKNKKISTRRETWKSKTTGATYSATRTPFANDQFEDIRQGSGSPTTTKPRGSKQDIEGTPTPNGPDNERPRMVTRDAAGNEIDSRPLTPAEATEWRANRERSRNPGGKTDQQIEQERKAAETKAQQEATRNKPGAPTIKPDGKGGSIAVQTMPDGTIKTTPLPGVPSESPRITLDGVVYEKGPDGQFAPAKGIPLPGATSKNIEPFVPDPAAGPDLGLGAWSAAQRQRMGLPPEQGGFTQSEWNDAATAAREQATVYIQNVTSNQTVRRQQEQDERTQRQQLSSQSAADYATARGAFDANLQFMNPDKPGIDSYIPAIMAEQQRYRQQREATARPATPLHPMFQALPAAAGVSPPPVVTVPPPAAPAPPVVAPVAPVAPGAPVQSAGAPVVAPPPAQAGAPAVQPMIPPSVIQATTGTTNGLINNLIQPQPPGGQPPTAPVSTPVSTPPPVSDPWPQYAPLPDPTMGPDPGQTVMPASPAPAATPAPIDPYQAGSPPLIPQMQEPTPEIIDPYQPDATSVPGPLQSKVAPGGLVSAWANPLLAPQPAAPGGQPVLNLQQPAAAPTFDPFPVAGRLAQMGLPADAVAQAMMELGMVPQQGGGVA